jgi:D-3-phosphoglycerate dehydrogenase
VRVLVTETLSEQGLDLLRKDFQVDVRADLAKGDLAGAIAQYDALVIRSSRARASGSTTSTSTRRRGAA